MRDEPELDVDDCHCEPWEGVVVRLLRDTWSDEAVEAAETIDCNSSVFRVELDELVSVIPVRIATGDCGG